LEIARKEDQTRLVEVVEVSMTSRTERNGIVEMAKVIEGDETAFDKFRELANEH
jgi:hypothetical protein